MKLTKKKVFATATAVSLVAILSMGTLAWFNATDEVTNKFLVADSDGDGAPDFEVDVWETDPSTGEKDFDGLTYEDIAPGDVLEKDPHVFNKGDYDQWIRVYVTFSDWSTIKAACDTQGIKDDLRTWLSISDSAWTPEADEIIDTNNDTITYVYYLNEKLKPDTGEVFFKTVTIPGEFEQEDMNYGTDGFSINVKAEALQADNTGNNAKDAFKEFWNY